MEEDRENLILLYIHRLMGLDGMLPKVLRKLGSAVSGQSFIIKDYTFYKLL